MLIGHHIGVVLNAKQVSLFHSLGSYKKPCNINSDSNHGPIKTPLSEVYLKNINNGQYKVLRIIDSLYYNLTSDSVKMWKVNPQGATTYCGQNLVNPSVAMDDIFIFQADGKFLHEGGTVTVDPDLHCNDGGDYSSTWAFNDDQTSVIVGGGELSIISLGKSRMILITPDGKLDLIPY
ncbi:MAG: hypothetical protein QM763_19140 [Agriterribacter sp.]